MASKNFSSRNLNREFARNLRARDASALVAAYYADEACILPPNQPIVKGRRAILRYWRGLFQLGLYDIKLKTHRIEASGDLAYEIGQWEIAFHGRPKSRGKHLLVFRRSRSGWKVVADMMNPAGPIHHASH